MSQPLSQFKESMQLRGLSKNTQNRYFSQVLKMAEHLKLEPEQITAPDIRQYLFHLVAEEKEPSTVGVAYYGILFFCRYALEKPEMMCAIPRMKRKKRSVAKCLEMNEVRLILKAVENEKYRLVLKLIYSAGLRISEAMRLRVCDIDSSNMRIYVQESKNGKDRYTVLSNIILQELRLYWRRYRPEEYLFPGQKNAQTTSMATIQNAFKQALKVSGIQKPATVHILRHCFATHLLDNGTDLHILQKLLGHASIKTTAIYLHMTRRTFNEVKSPLDLE